MVFPEVLAPRILGNVPGVAPEVSVGAPVIVPGTVPPVISVDDVPVEVLGLNIELINPEAVCPADDNMFVGLVPNSALNVFICDRGDNSADDVIVVGA